MYVFNVICSILFKLVIHQTLFSITYVFVFNLFILQTTMGFERLVFIDSQSYSRYHVHIILSQQTTNKIT